MQTSKSLTDSTLQETAAIPGNDPHGGAEGQLLVASITKYKIAADNIDDFHSIAANYVKSALYAPGNIMAEAYDERDHDDFVWIIERWETPSAKDIYNQCTQARVLNEAASMTGNIFEELSVNDLEPLTKEEWRKKPNAADKPFTCVLLLNAVPGTHDRFKEIYHQAMPEFRGEKGVVTYQVSQAKDDETKFITYEKFRDDDAFQFHLKFPPINPVIDFLRTSIQDPPFEKGLHKLVEFAPLNFE